MMLLATLRPTVASSLLLLALSGCATLGALSTASTPLAVFDLRAQVDGPVMQGQPLALDVIVELPTTGGVLETDRIMIRPDDLQAQYLPDVRWGDEVPIMLQTLMLRTLENTGGLRYVGRRPLAGSGDYAIVTELVDFQAELAPDGVTPVVSIRMTSRLVRERDVNILSTRTFAVQTTATSTENAALIRAFDAAADAIMLDFADWTITALGRRLTPA